MSIRKKILLYFSTVAIGLTGGVFVFVFMLFAEYREEEFQQEQKKKITSTLTFLTDIRKIDEGIIQSMDRITIHDFYDEKLLLYDGDKELIYASIDDLKILEAIDILDELSPETPWIETKEGLYDVIGMHIEQEGQYYYGISKAYDAFGYSKMQFLRYVLWATFAVFSIAVILISHFLSRKITQSIEAITGQIKEYNFDQAYRPIVYSQTHSEVAVLAQRFNELMKKMNEAFAFQKHAIQHFSHELKTPIAILVSNFERLEGTTDPLERQLLLEHQKKDTKSLGEIINNLLELSKVESGDYVLKDVVRIDELIFDTVEELNKLHPDFIFNVDYVGDKISESDLTIQANRRLMKSAIMNLLHNCIQYSNTRRAFIAIDTGMSELEITLRNSGTPIREEEKQYLFKHFFRGENSLGKRGFGLGLVFVYKIITIHQGSIQYRISDENENVFHIRMPLRREA